MALIHFALTLFVSAFILFLVQPLIGKLVLPKLGGTPQVWNTCMVFFQAVLLIGYGYTHFVSTKLKPRAQVIVHSVVVLVPFLVFVFFNMYWTIKGWVPNLGGNPIFGTLAVLFTVIGVPFFVVSTTAPLLQKWFGFTGHEAAKDPYFLYGASNLGSMLSLVLYPVAIEPFTQLETQTQMWMAGYGALVVLVFIAVAMVWKQTGAPDAAKVEAKRPEISTMPVTGEVLAGAIQSKPSAPKANVPAVTKTAPDVESIDGWRRLRWVALAAVPSSMMLGITSHITTDLSPMPMFWLIPLAFYLLSFILVFARWPMVWVERPHTAMVVLQPIFVALMILVDVVKHFQGLDRSRSMDLTWPVIACNLLAFVFTVMVCHGELAKDRPSVRYLTDFYLMMSVGGVVGGILNALIAPLVPWVFELNMALIAACLLRPNLTWGNWLDNFVASMADKTPEPTKKGKAAKIAIEKPDATAAGYGLDVFVGIAVFAIAFAINMLFATRDTHTILIVSWVFILLVAVAFFARGLRFGLAIAGIVLGFELYLSIHEGKSIVYRTRSFFGVIRVNQTAKDDRGNELPDGHKFRTLMHGHINHGQNYVKPVDPSSTDYSRLATTYYHRKGPAGIVMEKFNWFPNATDNNSFWADNRMPAAVVGQAAFNALGTCNLPLGDLVEAWSEPPYATIGLGTGTMASYGRPFQHVHFYEIDDKIRRLSQTIPHPNDPYFTYLKGAQERGANVQVFMGDARQRMALPYGSFDSVRDEVSPEERKRYVDERKAELRRKIEALEKDATKSNPDAQKVQSELDSLKRELATVDTPGGPENFYHMMVVDAFSSDAIPAHLLTKEAFEMYFKHLTPDGILCVHTSNRYVDLPRVVADVAKDLGLVAFRGHDSNPLEKDKGRFTSEWVMVANRAKRDPNNPDDKTLPNEYLKHLQRPAGYAEDLAKDYRAKYGRTPSPAEAGYWEVPATYEGKYLWTDDYYNLLSIMRLFTGPRQD